MSLSTQSHDISSSSPIGIFDSGIGGLTIVDCIKQQLPNEQLIYIADNQFAPYGDKSADFIIQRVNEIADYFIARKVKAIVIACNTATVIAIDQLRQRIEIPVIGVEPAIKPAVLTTAKQKVAILATQATANNERFLSLVKKHSANTDVFIQPCPGLVEVIEQGDIHSDETRLLLNKFILPLIDKGIDKLVLGCTHYPMLNKQIKAIVGDKIALIDTAKPVVKQLERKLNEAGLLAKQLSQPHIWLSSQVMGNTSLPKGFANQTKPLANCPLVNEITWQAFKINV